MLEQQECRHDIVGRALYMLGLQVAELYDQLIFTTVDGATNEYRPNAKTTDTGLVASDTPSYTDLVSLLAILQTAGGRPINGPDYVFATAPQVHAAMLRDPDFKASNQFAAPEKIWNGEVQKLGGFRVVITNAPAFAPTLQSGAGQSSRVYSSFAIANQAYMITDLQSIQVYNTPPGGQADPLYQNRKLGWKFAFKSVIVNQTWLRRVRTSGQDSVTN